MLMKVQLIARKCCFGISGSRNSTCFPNRTYQCCSISSFRLPRWTAKNTTVTRNSRMEKSAHWRKSTEMHQEDVTLKVVR